MRRGSERLRILIAGGGVAGLEALLALRELAGDRVEITLMAPEDDFRYRQLSVAMPFGLANPTRFPLDEIARENAALHRRASLARVDAGRRIVTTNAETEVPYDFLLIAIGARPAAVVPGAVSFAGFDQVDMLREGIAGAEGDPPQTVVFAVPDGAFWSVPLYELALLTAADAAEHDADVEVRIVSAEQRPLSIFGKRASDAVAEVLAEAGIAFEANRVAERFADGALDLQDGAAIQCDLVVSLPIPEVPEIQGLPQRPPHGYIPVDRYGAVEGLEGVFAAGDATSFPIKQGGLAAQQADAAVGAIAELAGAPAVAEPFRPVLRAVLLTPRGPLYLRAEEVVGASAASRRILWWPPSKIAGRWLAPYLARKAGGHTGIPSELIDVEPPVIADLADSSSDHEDLVSMALDSADIHAAERDFARALDWLKVAEDLDLYLPPDYELKRVSWIAQLMSPSSSA
jgi:sulfide:quinone oxidoreductase